MTEEEFTEAKYLQAPTGVRYHKMCAMHLGSGWRGDWAYAVQALNQFTGALEDIFISSVDTGWKVISKEEFEDGPTWRVCVVETRKRQAFVEVVGTWSQAQERARVAAIREEEWQTTHVARAVESYSYAGKKKF